MSNTSNDARLADAYRAMETPISELKHMSVIVEKLYEDFQPDNKRREDDAYVHLTLTSDQYDTLEFAIHVV
jgi:hypothetical protein